MSIVLANVKGKLHLVAGISLIAFTSVFSVGSLPTLRVAENLTYDLRISYFSGFRDQSSDIVILGITDETLSLFPYRSPIDRQYLSDLLFELESKGARAIGLDILIDQPTESEKDATLKSSLNVIQIPLVVATAGSNDGLLPAQIRFQEEFLEGVKQGSAAVITDNVDGVVRAVSIFRSDKEENKLSFVPQLAQALGLSLPNQNTLHLDYQHGPDETTPVIPIYPAHTISLLPKEWFAGKVVLIGFELKLEDRHLTPLSRGRHGANALSGVQIHAQALAQLLEGRRIYKAGFKFNLVLASVLAAIGLSLLVLPFTLRLQLVIAATLLIAVWIGGILLFVKGSLMISLLSASLSLILSSLVSFLMQWKRERDRKEFIHRAFSKYLSPAYVDQLVANPEKLSVKGEHRVVTFLFTDLAGFTPLTEALDPADLVLLINEYLDKTCEIATSHGGMVATIVGDALHVLFNAPVTQEDHAQRAVEAALELDEFCQKFAAAKHAEGIPVGETRIGINTGKTVVGNFGGKERIEYTAMGDAINTAARLESVNKHLTTRICISETTVTQCAGISFRPVGSLVLKGKTESVKVYEPLHSDLPQQSNLDEYLRAYTLMERQDSDALKAFKALADSNRHDHLVSFHLDRLRKGQSGATIIMEEK